MPDILVADKLAADDYGHITTYSFQSRLGEHGAILVSEEAAKGSSRDIRDGIGHEWGHMLILHNKKKINDFLMHDARFQVEAHNQVTQAYLEEWKKLVDSVTVFSKKEKKQIYNEVISNQMQEITADRFFVLITCDTVTAKEKYASPKDLSDIINERLSAAPLSDTPNEQEIKKVARDVLLSIEHPPGMERVKYFEFPETGNQPPGCFVGPLQTPTTNGDPKNKNR